MEEQKQQERLERFDYLMGILDKWTEATPARDGGMFKNLHKDAQVREFIVTPRSSIDMAKLKTFLATEVLEIYPRKTPSKITWREIRCNIIGKTSKKYACNFEGLDKCFSPEENRKALLNTQLAVIAKKQAEDLEDWRGISIYLLGRLQEVFQKMLMKYWRMCDENFDESMVKIEKYDKSNPRRTKKAEDDEDEEADEVYKQKYNNYLDCLKALALYEIFVREFLGNWIELLEETRQYEVMLKETSDQIKEMRARFDKADETGKMKLVEHVEKLTQEVDENIKRIGESFLFQLLNVEYNISLEAVTQLVMLLERQILEEIREDKGKCTGWEEEMNLKFLEGRYLASLEMDRKNRRKDYRHLESMVKDIFGRYMESIPSTGQKDISNAIETYLRLLGQEKLNDRQMKELWNTQCIISNPILAGKCREIMK